MQDPDAIRPGLKINGRTIPGTTSVVRIGRDEAAEVRYDDPRVSRSHAVIEHIGTTWILRDTSARGVFRGPSRVTELVIDADVVLRLADPHDGPELLVALAEPSRSATPQSREQAGIRINGREFGPDRPHLTVGRGSDADVTVDDPRVSRRHAVIGLDAQGWFLRDTSSTGTFRQGVAVIELRIIEATTVRLGDADGGPSLELTPLEVRTPARHSVRAASGPSELGRLSVVHEGGRDRIRIGRAPDNDIVLSDLLVSRHHAEVQAIGTTRQVVDLGSHNGTFVNGRRVDRAPVVDGDVLSFGAHVLRYSAGALEEYVDRGEAWLLASGLSAWTEDRRQILSDVSFALPPAGLLAIAGPSGSGKTTLLNALTGFRPADAGSVWYGGRDLYAGYDDLRQTMGFVPQTDIIHGELTVRSALRFAAALRFPADVDEASRHQRVEEVMQELGLGHRADVRIERLSGGQRKRASVALELLTKPSLLLLDEPTSGLDPANEEQVVTLLRALTDGGRIVVVATHSIEILRHADRVLLLAPGGKLAYYGEPAPALDYFARSGTPTDFIDVYRLLEESSDTDWGGRFKRDPMYEAEVGRHLTGAKAPASGTASSTAEARPKTDAWRQLGILARRYVSVLGSDRRNVVLTALQAPFFGALIVMLFSFTTGDVMTCGNAPNATILAWLLVIGASWLGASNAIREIVKELPIYRRERTAGLSSIAYLGSKVMTLSAITLAQSAILVGIVLAFHPLEFREQSGLCAQYMADAGLQSSAALGSHQAELVIAIGAAGIGAMSLALLASALVTRVDKAATLLPYILIVQTLLSQPFLDESNQAFDQVGSATTASWGVAAVASTLGLNHLRAPYLAGVDFMRFRLDPTTDPAESNRRLEEAMAGAAAKDAFTRDRWRQDPATWFTSVGAMVGLSLLFLAGAAWALRKREATTPRRAADQRVRPAKAERKAPG